MKKLDKYIQKTNFDKAYIGDAEGQEDLSPTETARHIDKIKITYFNSAGEFDEKNLLRSILRILLSSVSILLIQIFSINTPIKLWIAKKTYQM